MSVNLSLFAGAGWQFFDNNGVPLAGGLLYTYTAGTTTPLTTYTSNLANVPNSNPIVLNSAGRLDNEIWLTQGLSYKFVLETSTNVVIGTYDNISGANDQTALNTFIATLAGPTGSSLVGYNEGGNSAVNRTVQSKLQEYISVKDFGAKGDGVTNDTTACQNAWNAVKALGGGVLYFPNGTYLCNIVGLGSDNVSIQGAGAGSNIISYTTNAFAITYDTGFPSAQLFINDISFDDATNEYSPKKHGIYVNTGTGFALNNVYFNGLGIGFCNNATWGFKFDSCYFNRCYCCVFSTATIGSGTSITNVNGQTVTITNAFFIQHPGLLLFTNTTLRGNICHYFEQPDFFGTHEANNKYIKSLIEPINGCGIYVLDGGGFHNISFDETWFEGTLGTVAIRSLTLPAAYAYSNGTNLMFENLNVGGIVIAGDCLCTLRNVSTSDNLSFLSSGTASYIADGFKADSLGGYFFPWYAESVQNFKANATVTFYTTPKTTFSRGFKANLMYSNTCFAADTLFSSFGGTVTHSVANSSFTTLECFQIVTTITNNGAYLNPAYLTFDTTSVYVYTFTAQSLGSDFDAIISSPIGNSKFTIPSSALQTFAVIGTAETATSSGMLLMLNESGSGQTWLVSGIQVLKFNNYSEAARFLASGTFNIV